MTATAWVTTAAATGMTDVSNTAAATAAAMSAATISPSTANIAAAATIAAAVVAVVIAVVIPAVVEIAVAADHPTQHASNHAADDRFGNSVIVTIIPDLLDLRVGLYRLRTGNAGHAGESGRRREHHSSADNCCNSNTFHLVIPFLM